MSRVMTLSKKIKTQEHEDNWTPVHGDINLDERATEYHQYQRWFSWTNNHSTNHYTVVKYGCVENRSHKNKQGRSSVVSREYIKQRRSPRKRYLTISRIGKRERDSACTSPWRSIEVSHTTKHVAEGSAGEIDFVCRVFLHNRIHMTKHRIKK